MCSGCNGWLNSTVIVTFVCCHTHKLTQLLYCNKTGGLGRRLTFLPTEKCRILAITPKLHHSSQYNVSPCTYTITIAPQDAKIKEGTSISAKKKTKQNNYYNKMINWQARGSNRHGMQLYIQVFAWVVVHPLHEQVSFTNKPPSTSYTTLTPSWRLLKECFYSCNVTLHIPM